MSVEDEQDRGGEDRLGRFRRLMSQLDPAGDPARAFYAGLYVSTPTAVSVRIAARLALAPSRILLVGGVGSGKTTELLAVARRLLDRTTDTFVAYIDISKGHDIAEMSPGVVVVQVGLGLADLLIEPTQQEQEAARALGELAHGYRLDGSEFDDIEDGTIQVEGLLKPPARFEETVRSGMELVERILLGLRRRKQNVVVLLDGLDRMTDTAAFEAVVTNDIRSLAASDVGVILVGPLKSRYGMDRTIEQHFDEVHYQQWIDQTSSAAAGRFLKDLLRRRLPDDALTEAALDALVTASGGVLRDLVALAQLACMEAFMGESEAIEREQVMTAVDIFGRKHMQGLRREELVV